MAADNKASKEVCFSCGLLSGALQAGLFNPYDRALYLMHKHKRPFLTLSNWKSPYEGFHQSVFHRIVSGGMFFPVEGLYRRSHFLQTMKTESNLSTTVVDGVAGMGAGLTIAIATNPLAMVKYQSWGSRNRGEMLKTVKDMIVRGGFQSFGRGIHLTVLRDIIWGGTYSVLRFSLPGVLERNSDFFGAKPSVANFVGNMIAAASGTVMSSPINYARNLRFSHNVEYKAHSVLYLFQNLWNDARQHHASTGISRTRYLLGRLAIGWGTLRVGVGVAFSSQAYNLCLEYLA